MGCMLMHKLMVSSSKAGREGIPYRTLPLMDTLTFSHCKAKHFHLLQVNNSHRGEENKTHRQSSLLHR